jgi:hypothetical protein
MWRKCIIPAVVILSGLLVGGFGPSAAQEQLTAPPESIVLTHGPIHEAFAAPIVTDAAPSLFVARTPPPAVPEIPPSERPATSAAIWIPGYWGWNEASDDFVWVSGVWRVPPPHHRWNPGQWSKAGDGSRWVPGYWTAEDLRSLRYLPDPPARIDEQPEATRPGAGDFFWVPGSWVWSGEQYDWHAGYWARVQTDWVWTPSQLISMPRGVVLVRGFWDHPLPRRGLLFAPIDFGDTRFYEPKTVFSPAVLIRPTALTDQLFVWPRYHHYYFGDYFAPQFARAGIYPWLRVLEQAAGWHDPLFIQQRFLAEFGDPQWLDQLRNSYRYLLDNPAMRPPRTLAGQGESRAAVKLSTAIARRELPFRFQWLSPAARVEIAQRALSPDGLTPSVPLPAQPRTAAVVERVVPPSETTITFVPEPTRPLDRLPLAQPLPGEPYSEPRLDYYPGVSSDERAISRALEHREVELGAPRHSAHTAHQPYEQTQEITPGTAYREPYLRRFDAGTSGDPRPNLLPAPLPNPPR